jgi:hypothetical protein
MTEKKKKSFGELTFGELTYPRARAKGTYKKQGIFRPDVVVFHARRRNGLEFEKTTKGWQSSLGPTPV